MYREFVKEKQKEVMVVSDLFFWNRKTGRSQSGRK